MPESVRASQRSSVREATISVTISPVVTWFRAVIVASLRLFGRNDGKLLRRGLGERDCVEGRLDRPVRQAGFRTSRGDRAAHAVAVDHFPAAAGKLRIRAGFVVDL